VGRSTVVKTPEVTFDMSSFRPKFYKQNTLHFLVDRSAFSVSVLPPLAVNKVRDSCTLSEHEHVIMYL
jgi:hypothetical protein